MKMSGTLEKKNANAITGANFANLLVLIIDYYNCIFFIHFLFFLSSSSHCTVFCGLRDNMVYKNYMKNTLI